MQKIRSTLDSEPWLLSFWLVLAGGVVYLPFIAGMGYFNDDWYLMYAAGAKGWRAFYDIFIVDRPMRAMVMAPTYMLFGSNPILYNLSGWLFRTISAVLFFRVLIVLFEDRKKMVFSVALLYLLYPGFLSQFNGIDYQSQMVSLAVAMASLLWIIYAYRSTMWIRIAIYFAAISLTTTLYLGLVEYFIGFEALKLAILFVLIFRQENAWLKRIQKSMMWAGYSIATAIPFLYWRLFVFESQRGATNVDVKLGNILSDPFAVLLSWALPFFQDVFDVTLNVWIEPLQKVSRIMSLPEWGTASILAGLVATLVWFVIGVWKSSPETEIDVKWRTEAMWLGVVMLVAGVIPVIVVGRQVDFQSFSRYALAPSVGSVLIWLLTLSFLSKKIRYAVLSLLVGFSALVHYANAFAHVRETEQMNAFWWQVSWRIPQMELGTTLLVNYADIVIEEDYFVWGPANLIYYPKSFHEDYPQPGIYAVLISDDTVEKIIALERQEFSERRSIRTYPNYRNILVISQPSSDSCVHVINGAQPEVSSHEDTRYLPVMQYSEDFRIMTGDALHVPPDIPFGSEPAHDWCYYYQKASLARQIGDWNEVVRLGEEASTLELSPVDEIEWMPFLEGYAMQGKTDHVRAVIMSIKDIGVREQACALLSRLGTMQEVICAP